VREQDGPAFADELVEVDLAMGRLSLEVGRYRHRQVSTTITTIGY
jgi:hypothetical protein